MNKENEIIECEYCHTLITEYDTICPKCGANCSKVIKKYKEEKQKKEQEKREKVENFQKSVFNHVQKGQRFARFFIFMIFVVAAFFMIRSFMKFSSFEGLPIDESNENKNNKVEDKVEKPQIVKVVKVSYKETAETNEMKVTLDSYDLYEYHSEHFESNNTPNGYQKIAFHFEIYNKSDRTMSTGMLIDLLADDSNVEDTDLELPKGFAELVKGKEKYEKIEPLQIKPNSTLKGYVGYLVPKDKKILKFTVGDYIIIEMDNPVYKG